MVYALLHLVYSKDYVLAMNQYTLYILYNIIVSQTVIRRMCGQTLVGLGLGQI